MRRERMMGVLEVCDIAVTIERPRVGEEPPAIAMVRDIVSGGV